MRQFRRFSAIQVLAIILLAGVISSADTLVRDELKLLPERIGVFKATSTVVGLQTREDLYNRVWVGERNYQSAKGERLTAILVKSVSDSGAYAVFKTRDNSFSGGPEMKFVDVGTLGHAAPRAVIFFKGSVMVEVNSAELPEYSPTLVDFARQLAETIDKGEGEIPPLVKHLPNWQGGDLRSSYSVTLAGLKTNVPGQPVFDAISFAGGAEAASAEYGPAKLVIVEFNTPQIATDNNQRIVAKIQELRSQSQPAPTAYRRVGNYAVFVFDAPSEQAANQLIDQVKYQQVVQWLGEDPFSYERATREFTETTLGVLVAVVKTSGLALVGCLVVGGFFGALLFARRRAQQRAVEAYVDGGAMLRLNIDELTPEKDPARLLEDRR